MVPQIPVLDMHSHFLINAHLLGKRFERRHGRAWIWNPLRNQYDLPRAKDGGVAGATFTMYVPWWPTDWMNGVMSVKRRFDLLVARSGGEVSPCVTAAQIREAMTAGRFAAPLALEGGHVVGRDLENLGVLHDMGVRMMTLVHFFSTQIGEAVWGSSRESGLTEFGRELVCGMQRTGMIVDLSHAARSTFYAAVGLAESPYVVSHTGFMGAGAGSRGLDDDQIRAIRETGGVMGVIFFPWYLRRNTIFAGIDLVADHICYGAEKAGVDHVAIGTDCDSNIWLPRGFGDVSFFPVLTAELLRRGMTEPEIRKVYCENYLRILEATDERFMNSTLRG